MAHDSFRIVIWSMYNETIDSTWLDVLGLGLKIPPYFFECLLHRMYYSAKKAGDSSQYEPYLETRFLSTQHVSIGSAVGTLLNGSKSKSGGTRPVVLIAYLVSHYELAQMNLLAREPVQGLSLNLPNTTLHQSDSDSDWLDGTEFSKRLSAYYQKLILQSLAQECKFDLDDSLIFHICLLPLLKIDTLGIQVICREAWEALICLRRAAAPGHANVDEPERDRWYRTLAEHRFLLRRNLEDSQDGLQFFRAHVKQRSFAKWLETPQYLDIEEHVEGTVSIARRLESEIRDYMQILVGDLSIKESRRSIELSNSQILESKRGQFLMLILKLQI